MSMEEIHAKLKELGTAHPGLYEVTPYRKAEPHREGAAGKRSVLGAVPPPEPQ